MSDNPNVAVLREAVAVYERLRDHLGGCTDGGCVVKRPRGMHTNGGCHCPRNHMKAQRMMYAGQRLHAAAITALEAQASAPGGEVTEWRDAFIHVSAMRYIDNGMMHDAAYEAAEQDARVTESANRAALAARTGKGGS